jgi:hypothetical protein
MAQDAIGEEKRQKTERERGENGEDVNREARRQELASHALLTGKTDPTASTKGGFVV